MKDVNYRTEETPSESENVNNNHAYEYDANGNLVYVNTSRTKKDGMADEKTAERKLKWDEENRLLASDDNGFVTNYWYDADGERTVKTSGESDQVYVNSEFAGGRTNTAKFSLYVSPYLVANQGGRYTKHIYIGSQRVVSKIGDFDSYGSDPRRIPYAGHEADGLTINYKDKYNQQLQSIKDNYKAFDQPYNGKDNDDYVNGQGFCCNDGTLEAAQARVRTRAANGNFKPNDDYEKMQFYYHPDHLGSSSYITNLDGEVLQHIEYVPFGEVFIEERNNTWNTPYLFNAKEFDEETGMYYYGARYYDPRLGLWMSTDPMQEKYPMSTTYCFVNNNPIKEIDPDGCDGYVIINGNKITITANVYLYGAGATKSVAEQMQKDVNGKWSSSTFSAKSANGTSFRVSVKVKILLYNNKEKSDPFIIPQSWNPYNRDNFVEVGANDKRSYVTGGDEGLWRSQGRNGRTLAEDDSAPHEIGHMLGLTDRYKDKNRASVTDIGWENNIMGNSRTGKVEQRNIDGILKDSMKAYNNWIKNPKNKGKEFRYEIDKDTPDK